MKTPIDLLTEKCNIVSITFHDGQIRKSVFVLNSCLPDMEKKFLRFDNVEEIETYSYLEQLTPNSNRKKSSFAVYPKTFVLSTDMVSKGSCITSEDAEYAELNVLLLGLYNKHLNPEPEKKVVEVKKEIIIAS